jgi:molecular chaperone DnaK
MTTLIPRNTTIPTRKSEVFSTAADDQPSVEVHVLQGERKMAGDNRTLAKFGLEGIAPAPRGMPQIEVAFDIDANGIVHVSATDKATGKAQKVTIKSSTGLSDTEIQRMVDDAKRHEAEDARRKEEAENRNALEAMMHQSERLAAEHGERLPPAARQELEAALAEAKAALEERDDARIKGARERLTKASHALAQAMYGHREHETAGAGAQPEHAREDVIDAEFEERN